MIDPAVVVVDHIPGKSAIRRAMQHRDITTRMHITFNGRLVPGKGCEECGCTWLLISLPNCSRTNAAVCHCLASRQIYRRKVRTHMSKEMNKNSLPFFFSSFDNTVILLPPFVH